MVQNLPLLLKWTSNLRVDGLVTILINNHQNRSVSLTPSVQKFSIGFKIYLKINHLTYLKSADACKIYLVPNIDNK